MKTMIRRSKSLKMRAAAFPANGRANSAHTEASPTEAAALCGFSESRSILSNWPAPQLFRLFRDLAGELRQRKAPSATDAKPKQTEDTGDSAGATIRSLRNCPDSELFRLLGELTSELKRRQLPNPVALSVAVADGATIRAAETFTFNP